MALRGRTEREGQDAFWGRERPKRVWVRGGRKTMAEGGGKGRATHLLSCLIFFFSASVSLSFLTGAFLMGMVVG